MPVTGTVGAVCDQHGILHVSWKVENFFSLSEAMDDWYKSPEFQFLDRSFFLTLNTNGSSSHQSQGWIGLFLSLSESCPPMQVECTLGVKPPEGSAEAWSKFHSTFHERNKGVGKARYLWRPYLLSRKHQLAPSDAVIFRAYMKPGVSGPMEGIVSEVATQTTSEDIDHECRPLVKTGCEKVAKDLGMLWSSSENSDVTVKVGDVEFQAHRAILGARTPVLRAMFNHDTEEKESGVVTITDCQPKIFEEFLHYIYTGSPLEFTGENVFGLYSLAEKYLVDDLKKQCVRYIRSTLSVETFCDIVLLALTHGEAELLDQALNFATRNIRLIIRSVQWQKFNVEHPTKANEILITAMEPHEIVNHE